MFDNDLIRRGDAAEVGSAYGWDTDMFRAAIAAIPAAPVTLAQALEVPEVRALVEAVERLLAWDQRRGYPIPYRTRDPLLRALAALEQKGGA